MSPIVYAATSLLAEMLSRPRGPLRVAAADSNGGRGIRTPKSFRTAVFKTAALAILPALPVKAVYPANRAGQPSPGAVGELAPVSNGVLRAAVPRGTAFAR